MKRNIIAILVILICILFRLPNDKNITQANAAENGTICNIVSEITFETLEKARDDRSAGSEGEKSFANTIIYEMEKYAPSFIKQGKNGDAKSAMYLDYNGEKYVSENLIFKKGNSEKKVIITCAYDNFYGLYGSSDKQILVDGYFLSTLPVATSILLASKLNSTTNEFAIEFVFLGSENLNGYGSENYFHGVGDEECSNILSVINIGNLYGNNLYAASNIDNNNFNLVYNAINTNNSFNKYDLKFDTALSEQSKIGYSSKFYNRTISNVSKNQIRVISIFGANDDNLSGQESIDYLDSFYNSSNYSYCYDRGEEISNGIYDLLINEKCQTLLSNLSVLSCFRLYANLIATIAALVVLVLIYFISLNYKFVLLTNAKTCFKSVKSIEALSQIIINEYGTDVPDETEEESDAEK